MLDWSIWFIWSIWSIWFIWFIWFVLFIWFVWFNQIIETDQTDGTDQTDQTTVFLCWRTFKDTHTMILLLRFSHRACHKIYLNHRDARGGYGFMVDCP